jgi:xanthine dehydrogenase accessory factor
MHSLVTWKFILENLEDQVPVMLLYVLESRGSSPGRQGFFMAVNSKSEMEGSIGGGMMEHKWVEAAKERLKQNQQPEIPDSSVRRQVHSKSAGIDQSGMICSGEQTILLYPVGQHDAPQLRSLINSLENFRNGQLELTPQGILFSEKIPARDFHFEFKAEDNWLFRERTGYKKKLAIIGGGHCALALSRLMREMDYYIRVYDNRPDLKTMMVNRSAHELHVVNSYSELELLMEDPEQYVVIMTFGYRTDDEVMRALQGKKFVYLGLLGSRNKIDTMMQQYRAEGFDEEWMKSVHAPIGLDIHSQTPEEIAVSIAAEIIRDRNKQVK